MASSRGLGVTFFAESDTAFDGELPAADFTAVFFAVFFGGFFARFFFGGAFLASLVFLTTGLDLVLEEVLFLAGVFVFFVETDAFFVVPAFRLVAAFDTTVFFFAGFGFFVGFLFRETLVAVFFFVLADACRFLDLVVVICWMTFGRV